jgi:hypothetical protein
MLTEKLTEITAELNQNEPQGFRDIWNFVDGNNEWQNLGDYPEDAGLEFAKRKKYLLLLWKDREHTLSDLGSVQGFTFTGDMILSVRSKISDPTYNYKYEQHIKNLYSVSEKILNMFSDCDGFVIKRWKESEVIDTFDTNMDGLKISFTIEFTY